MVGTRLPWWGTEDCPLEQVGVRCRVVTSHGESFPFPPRLWDAHQNRDSLRMSSRVGIGSPFHGKGLIFLRHHPSKDDDDCWSWQSMTLKLGGEKKCRVGTWVMLIYWWQRGVGRKGHQAIATNYATCIENLMPN